MEDTTLSKITITKLDYDEGYATDSLTEVLEQELACYHICRIASIFLSKYGSGQQMTKDEEQLTVIKIMRKIMGTVIVNLADVIDPDVGGAIQNNDASFKDANTEDFGWLERQSGGKGAPVNYFLFLRRFYAKTIEKNMNSRVNLGAYRLCELLDPFIERSLFKSVFSASSYFSSEALKGKFFYVNLTDFSETTRTAFHGVYETRNLKYMQFMPEFLRDIVSSRGNLVKRVDKKIWVPLDMEQYLIFSFLRWFSCFSKGRYNYSNDYKIDLNFELPESRVVQSTSSWLFGGNLTSHCRFNIYNIFTASVPLQIAYRWFKFFISSKPRVQSSPSTGERTLLFLEIFVEVILQAAPEDSTVPTRLSVVQLQLIFLFLVEQMSSGIIAEHEVKTPWIESMQGQFSAFFISHLKSSKRGDSDSPARSGAKLHHLLSVALVYLSPWNNSFYQDDALIKETLKREKEVSSDGFYPSFSKSIDELMSFADEKFKQLMQHPGSAKKPIVRNKGQFACIWFVVRQYRLYKETFGILFRRFTESAMTAREINLVAQMFGKSNKVWLEGEPLPPINDFVLIIIMCCEVIISKLPPVDPSQPLRRVSHFNLTEEMGTLLSKMSYWHFRWSNEPQLLAIVEFLQQNQDQMSSLLNLGVDAKSKDLDSNAKREEKAFPFVYKDKVDKILEQMYLHHNELLKKESPFDWLFPDVINLEEGNVSPKRLKSSIRRLHQIFDVNKDSNPVFIFKDEQKDQKTPIAKIIAFFIPERPVEEHQVMTIQQKIGKELLQKAAKSFPMKGYYSSYEVSAISDLLRASAGFLCNILISDPSSVALKETLIRRFSAVGDVRNLLWIEALLLILNLLIFRVGGYFREILLLFLLGLCIAFKEIEALKAFTICLGLLDTILFVGKCLVYPFL